MTDKTSDKQEPPEQESDSRIEYIELGPEIGFRVSATYHETIKHEKKVDSELPDFPSTAEEWEKFDKSHEDPELHRQDFVEYREKTKPPTTARQLGTRAGLSNEIPDKIDESFPPGVYKPWEIIINPKQGKAYGFSKDEYGQWLEENKEHVISVTCENCSMTVTDNPFTGFKSCPHCGLKISVMGDLTAQIEELRTRLFTEAKRNAPKRKGFITGALDIPPEFLKSLSLPKFHYTFNNYDGFLGPIISLLIFLLFWMYFFLSVETLNYRFLMALVLPIALILNFHALSNSVNIRKIILEDSGASFLRFRGRKVFRYERIISIHLSYELTTWASIRQRNPLLILLISPLTLLTYVVTLGNVNLFHVFRDPYGNSTDDSAYQQRLTIKTRAASVQLVMNKTQNPYCSRLMGILIYMALRESPRILINPNAFFAAQKAGSST